MTDYLLDTNVLLRMSDRTSPVNLLAGRATATLLRQRDRVFITSQNIIEFWVVATRPAQVNGLGWSVEQTGTEIELIFNQFPLNRWFGGNLKKDNENENLCSTD
jgi:hypothetical protein